MIKGRQSQNISRTHSDKHSLSWEQIAQLLTSQSQCPSHKSNSLNKKLQLKLLDTVFLHQTKKETTSVKSLKGEDSQNRIKQWYFTTKKGEVTRRKDPSTLTLQHLHDRFCRFSLANSSNAAGPRIVAIGHSCNDERVQGKQEKISCPAFESLKQRINYTEEQLKREVQHEIPFGLHKCIFLQCYLRPYGGNDQFYRGLFQLVFDSSKNSKKLEPNNMDVKSEIMTQIVEDPLLIGNNSASGLGYSVRQFDPKCSTLLKWIQQEVETSTLKLVTHLESTMHLLPLNIQEDNNETPEQISISDDSDHPSRIVSLMADFILDDNKQLWISCIDNVTVSSEKKLVEQIHMVSKQCSSQQYNIEQNLADLDIVLPRINESKESSNKLDMNDEKINSSMLPLGSIEQNGNDKEQKSTGSTNDSILKADIMEENHESILQTNIAQLRSQLDTEETAKVESLVKINKLRKEAQAMLRLQPLEKEKKHNDFKRTVRSNQKEEVNRRVNIQNENEIRKIRKDLKVAKEQNENLQRAVFDRARNSETFDELRNKRDKLENLLQQEIFSKNELMKSLDSNSAELIEVKAQAKEDKERHQHTIQSERENYNKLCAQMRSSNQVLEAEVKVQRDYVNELRAGSWTDLAGRLKTQMEAAMSQELAKSSMCISQAVGSCEERWKRQVQEIQIEHQNEISKMKEQFGNDLRFNLSQNAIKLDEARHKIQEKSRKEYENSLDSALRRKELHRLSEVKSEARKWEQTMMEMKIRLISEQQQKARKNLIDRDEYWKTKLLRLQQEADEEKKEFQNSTSNEMKLMAELKDNEIANIMDSARKEKDVAVKEAKTEAKNERIALLKDKEIEIKTLLNRDREKVVSQMKDQMDEKEIARMKEEGIKMEEMKDQIDKLKAQNEKNEQIFNEKVESLRASCDNEVKKRAEAINDETKAAVKIETDKLMMKFKVDTIELTSKNQQEMEIVHCEANRVLAEQLGVKLEEEKKKMEESINSISEEYEEQIQTLEYNLCWEKSQKQTAEERISNLEAEVDAKESLVKETKVSIEISRIKHNFSYFYVIAKALSLKKSLHDKDDEMTSLINELQNKHDEKEQDQRKKTKVLENRSLRYEQQMKLVASTLLNHKRDELIDHKRKSRNVALQIEKVVGKMDDANLRREDLTSALSHLEEEMKDVEMRLQEHSKTSAIQGGKLNINHARKKRRLDEEYEQILSKIEVKRDEINVIDDELGDLTIEKNEFNDKMRGLERSLVELLVEQQKKLLSISSDIKSEK